MFSLANFQNDEHLIEAWIANTRSTKPPSRETERNSIARCRNVFRKKQENACGRKDNHDSGHSKRKELI